LAGSWCVRAQMLRGKLVRTTEKVGAGQGIVCGSCTHSHRQHGSLSACEKSSTPRIAPQATAHCERMTSVRLCSTWYTPRSHRAQICTNCQRLLAPESLPREREPRAARAPANTMLPKSVANTKLRVCVLGLLPRRHAC
jgi:hypothetical protein